MKDKDSQKYAYTGDFLVLDMKTNDIIIGLPALTGKLYPLMNTLLKEAHEDYLANEEQERQEREDYLNYLDVHNMLSSDIPLENPWLETLAEEAPEDADTELPVNFGDALTFLGKPREEAIQDYYKLLEDHVSDEFKKATDVLEFLKTEALDTFVPKEWSGVKGVEPIRLNWKGTLPDRLKPNARPINPKLYQVSQTEFQRLCGYFYRLSRSPWASCLVVAPKATPPYIRFCGDYITINRHMEVGNHTIPNVKHELDKIIDFPIYLDIDLTNAFHQIPIHPETSAKLSIQTPWGQYEPIFMPEGIAPATGILQEVVRDIFSDCTEWAIVIFDNMLILAKDYEDGFEKLKFIVRRCKERNLKLKMAKTWLGFTEVKFFGYLCKHKTYEVSPDKKEALAKLELPTSHTKAKSLLGKGVFFAPFTPNYSTLVGHLTDMTKKSFNWKPETWKHDYRQEFKDFIIGLQKACEVFFPNYELQWILRTDASEIGVGGVLLQVSKDSGEKPVLQPIAFISQRFSDAARKWATIEQEAYGIYYCVKKLAYYLVGKEFIVETDHNNLRWMEASFVPKIVRWRIYLQSFNFKIRHIPGRDNVIADWLSRDHDTTSSAASKHEQELARINPVQQQTVELDPQLESEQEAGIDEGVNYKKQQWLPEALDEVLHRPPEAEDTEKGEPMTKQQCLEAAHNKNVGHMGERTTWKRIQKWFPGSGISYQQVAEFVASCPSCIKTRLGMQDKLTPIYRTLKTSDARTAIGIDAVEITPHGKDGYTHINVIVNLFTKFVFLHPVKGVTALNLANSVWKYWTHFGHTDAIISDQGPDLKSKLMQQLVEYMGMRHRFSIADKHANGSERIIGEVVRHLRSKVYDSSAQGTKNDVFEDPSWLDSVMYSLNSEVNSETGYTPFELTFGTQATDYMKLAKGNLPPDAHARLRILNSQLLDLQSSSQKYQQELTQKRASAGVPQDKHNTYQPGDLVLFDKGPKVHPKMSHRYAGPYEVKKHIKNDVTCQHLATGEVKLFDVESLKIYGGARDTAFDAARRDQDQHVIQRIVTHRGDVKKRTDLVFTVEFADGDIKDLEYSKDLFDSIPYEDYCRSKPYLKHLLFNTKEANNFIKSHQLPQLKTNQIVYLDIMIYGNGWYYKLQLPDPDTTTYVSRFRITKVSKSHVDMVNPMTNDNHRLKAYDFYCFVHLEFDSANMTLIDEAFVVKYPQVTQE